MNCNPCLCHPLFCAPFQAWRTAAAALARAWSGLVRSILELG